MLLGGTCYHMLELLPRPEHVPLWHGAILGSPPEWDSMFEGFTAAVDWPAAAVWKELSEAYPEALVILSVRSSSEAWWNSFSQTILPVMQRGPDPEMAAWYAMASDMLERLTPDYADKDACIAAYEAHNEAARRAVPPEHFLEWTPSDGWGPLCADLGLAVPDEPFPHVNTTEEYRAMTGLDQPDGAQRRSPSTALPAQTVSTSKSSGIADAGHGRRVHLLPEVGEHDVQVRVGPLDLSDCGSSSMWVRGPSWAARCTPAPGRRRCGPDRSGRRRA